MRQHTRFLNTKMTSKKTLGLFFLFFFWKTLNMNFMSQELCIFLCRQQRKIPPGNKKIYERTGLSYYLHV